MKKVDITKIVIIKENNWILENGFIVLRRTGEKIIFNDSLTLIWLEIDGNSSIEEIAVKLYKKPENVDCMETIIDIVAEGLRILEEEGIVSLEEDEFTNTIKEDEYA